MSDEGEIIEVPPEAQPRDVKRIVKTAVVVVLAVLASFLAMVELWLFNTWESLSIDEIFYHLNTPLDGTNTDVITSYLSRYLPITIILIVVVCVLLYVFRKQQKAYRTCLCAILACSLCGLAWTFIDLDRHTSLFRYLQAFVTGTEVDFVADNYVDPDSVQITFPDEKKNLIYIFLESMETTYTDEAHGGAFEQNIIPNLTALAENNEDFRGDAELINGAYSLPGTQWTIGGMFAQTSGAPLKIPLSGNEMVYQDAFFPGMVVLGDILADEGYNQVLMVGSDAAFGGREKYFTEHGGYGIYDYYRALQDDVIPSGYYVFWGLEDEKLFDWAKSVVLDLAAKDEPFNLTLLTVDTHFEDGYVCRLCGDEFGDNQYANVFACSDRQIAAFVEWVQQQDFYQDTVIVINGDHTTMDTDFCEEVPEDYERRTYSCIVNGAASPADPTRQRTYSTFDMFPTTLVAMGATIAGDRLGIGVNLYGTEDTIIERYGLPVCLHDLDLPSEFLNRFSGVTITEDKLQSIIQKAWLDAAWYEPDAENPDPDKPSEPGITFYSQMTGQINLFYLESASLAITDARTGETTVVPMEIIPTDNPNSFWLKYYSTYKEDELQYLTAEMSIVVDGFDDRVIAWYPPEAEDLAKPLDGSDLVPIAG